MKHLYIHIPFCHRRCSYCDFNTYANMDDRIAAYVQALCAELGVRGQGLGVREEPSQLYTLHPEPRTLLRSSLRPTIFLGGGTPTMLSLEQMEKVLHAASAIVPLDGAEVTVEANPGTVLGGDYLRGLRQLGINRISMGVQSLHDPTLRMLGRIHTAAEARQSYEDARHAGFERINLDFMFGLPGQTVEQWRETLDEIVTWDAEHFSLYSLILEQGTPLHAQVTGGRLSIPDDDLTGEMYELAMAKFAAAGYAQYEISNWAKDREFRIQNSEFRMNAAEARSQKPEARRRTGEEIQESDRVRDNHSELSTLNFELPAGACHHAEARSQKPEARRRTGEEIQESDRVRNNHSELSTLNFELPAGACHHNLAYWLNADYLAAGAGAHGHVFPQRYFDVLKIDEYIATVRAGKLPTAEITELSQRDLEIETMFMGLRLNTGVSYAHFRDRCGVEMNDVFGSTLDTLVKRGLIERDTVGARLTPRGRMLGNQVFAEFV